MDEEEQRSGENWVVIWMNGRRRSSLISGAILLGIPIVVHHFAAKFDIPWLKLSWSFPQITLKGDGGNDDGRTLCCWRH